jgi:hypothetical protein
MVVEVVVELVVVAPAVVVGAGGVVVVAVAVVVLGSAPVPEHAATSRNEMRKARRRVTGSRIRSGGRNPGLSCPRRPH